MNNQQIVYLNVENIFPHPKNPRKDLGDLTELADSIKANGIMQNLTVIRQPWSVNDTKPVNYTVIIGHRRLAAAIKAGLLEVPCVITEMNEKKQLATMLLENMQRSDLTVYEQAEGFQMMIDFGTNVGEISKKTGFSETTVRRRVKLLDLDKDKFKSSVERGATLKDYEELDKITDVSLKNTVLDSIGTSNFQWNLKDAIRKEEIQNSKAKAAKILDRFAVQIAEKDTHNYKYQDYYSYSNEIEIPEDAGDKKYFYTLESWGIRIYTEKSDEEIETETIQDERKIENEEKRKKLKEISQQAFRLRFEFVKNFTQAKQNMSAIAMGAISALLNWDSIDENTVISLSGIELEDGEELSYEHFRKRYPYAPEYALLIAAYSTLDSINYNYYDYQGQHSEDEELDKVYDFLKSLGYQMSDEELHLQKGSHELFIREEENNA